MKNTVIVISFIIMGLISSNAAAISGELPSIGSSIQTSYQLSSWELKMIYQPSNHVLERERQGHVNIYDGFKSYQVEKILDDNFGRIENMMFTRVKMTDEYGEVMIDPETGNEMVSEDGCND